ncbi:hypothetical protein BRADI_1g37300v3 [Brachypodium distachyon]|uniref:Uncharacterized protein n=1 Tax=Brachypodium distachyon TaxID=15368 RepID=A0A0Q3H4V5_BRADI|nr:hypothetical protein BRADI_1g37300v3 [Brachypodium distachyon]
MSPRPITCSLLTRLLAMQLILLVFVIGGSLLILILPAAAAAAVGTPSGNNNSGQQIPHAVRLCTIRGIQGMRVIRCSGGSRF